MVIDILPDNMLTVSEVAKGPPCSPQYFETLG